MSKQKKKNNNGSNGRLRRLCSVHQCPNFTFSHLYILNNPLTQCKLLISQFIQAKQNLLSPPHPPISTSNKNLFFSTLRQLSHQIVTGPRPTAKNFSQVFRPAWWNRGSEKANLSPPACPASDCPEIPPPSSLWCAHTHTQAHTVAPSRARVAQHRQTHTHTHTHAHCTYVYIYTHTWSQQQQQRRRRRDFTASFGPAPAAEGAGADSVLKTRLRSHPTRSLLCWNDELGAT